MESISILFKDAHITYRNVQVAPLFSHFAKLLTPALIILTLSVLEVIKFLTSLDVKYSVFFFVRSLHLVRNIDA